MYLVVNLKEIQWMYSARLPLGDNRQMEKQKLKIYKEAE